MSWLAHMAHAAGQIVRPENNAVETWDGQDLINSLDGINMFDLGYGDDRLISGSTEASTSRAAITGRPPWPVPANTFRWISASGNRLACFARGTDVRDNNAVRADVQYRLNYGGIMRRHSHERGCRAFFCSHNVSLDRLQ